MLYNKRTYAAAQEDPAGSSSAASVEDDFHPLSTSIPVHHVVVIPDVAFKTYVREIETYIKITDRMSSFQVQSPSVLRLHGRHQLCNVEIRSARLWREEPHSSEPHPGMLTEVDVSSRRQGERLMRPILWYIADAAT